MGIKNVIIVSDYSYVEGGAANVAIQTAVILKQYTDVNVFFLAGSGRASDELIKNEIECFSLDMYDLISNPSKSKAFLCGIYNKKAEKLLKQYLRKFDPKDTIIHVHTWTKVLSSAIFKVARDMYFKVCLTVHDYFVVCPNGGCFNYVKNTICELQPMSVKCLCCDCDSRKYYYKLWRFVRQICQNNILNKCNNIHYIFISEFEKNQFFRRKEDVKHCSLVFNPIEFRNRKRINVEFNDYYAYIGRVSPEKGVDVFCDAIKRMGVRGVVIGDGPLRSKLEYEYPGINFVGWLDKSAMSIWLKKIRCLIFPSLWYEGAPLTPLEVQAHGIPCIVSNCSSAVDYIVKQENGYIYSDIEELCECIEYVKNDDAITKMSYKAFDYFDESKYSYSNYAKKIVKAYNEWL